MRCLRFLKRKVILFLPGLLLSIGLSLGVVQTGSAAVETVKAFGLVESGGPFTQKEVIIEPSIGGNGIANTTAAGDDVQVVAVGSPVNPSDIIVSSGANGVLDTVPAGDDVVTNKFNDGSVVYVRVDNGAMAGGSFANVTVTDDDSGEFITITVYDNGSLPDDESNDIYWWGKFTLKKGDGSGTGGDTLELSDSETAIISADLDSVDGPGTKQITADYTNLTDHIPPFVALSVSPSTISPNGDGINDSATISFSLDDNVSSSFYIRLEIRDSSDVIVRNLKIPSHSGQPFSTGSHTETWDGKNDAGVVVSDAEYEVYLITVDDDENSAQVTQAIAVDNTAPEITNVTATPSTISPENVDGTADSAEITFKATHAGGGITFGIYDGLTLVRNLTSSISWDTDHWTVTWDGKDDSASYVDDKSYTCTITAFSLGGTPSEENTDATVTIDNTAPSAPTGLSATAVSAGDIELSWTASGSGDAAQYNIYRATSSGGQSYTTPYDSVSFGTNTYTDTSTSDGVTYYYVVRTEDTVGNIETNTTEVSGTASASGPSFSSIVADSSAYKDGDTISLTVTLANHNTGCTLTADFSNIDSQYVTGGEAVVNWGTDDKDNDGDGYVDGPSEQGIYVISYLISLINTKTDGSHNIPVTATDAATNSTSSGISLTLDNTAPPAPTSLSAAAIVGGSIQLSWTGSSPETDVAQYNIYRASSSGGENYSSPTYTVAVGINSYTDASTSNGQTYYYVVRAQDVAGNIESNTNEVSATASGSGPPAPTGLTATAIAGGSIQLNWTLSSPETNVAQYNIYRAINSGEQNYASPLTNVSAGTSTYTDTATTDGETYYYVVRAQDAVGNTETNTNEASATADATAPPAPTDLVATVIVGSGIQLSWTPSSPETDVAQYNIYRASSSGGQNYSSPTYSVSAGNIGYTDTSVSDGTTYYYVVRAQDAAANIETNTNEVWATVSLTGPSVNVSDIYLKYEEELLYNLVSSTDPGDPAVFAKGKIDKIYLRLNLVGGFELNKSSSSIILFRGTDEDAEEVLGSEEIKEGAEWAEFIFHIDPAFDPDVDEHSRDALYWVDVSVASAADGVNDFDFYFIYDTTSPAVPDFGITSFDAPSGTISVSGKTWPDSSDPQQVEIFLNSTSQGVVTADGAGNFNMDNLILAGGDNYITVQSTDKAGNKSELSAFLHQRYNSQNLLCIVIRSSHVVKSGSATIPVTIIYAVTEPAQVTIHIHNLLGETVKEWSQWVNPGEEPEWSWLGENMYGETVNNGVYIVRVVADDGAGRRENVTKLLGVLR